MKVESENIFQIQFNYRTIIILESLGTYASIPSSSSSKVFDAPVLFFKVIFLLIICFISMEPHYVCGDMHWNEKYLEEDIV